MMKMSNASTKGMLRSKIGELDLDKLVLSFHRESDTLIVHFNGRGKPGISYLVKNEFMIRFDPCSEQVVGIQIEHFLSLVVPEHPRLLDGLDIAELRGITLEEVARIRREVATKQKRQTLDDVIAEFPPIDLATDSKREPLYATQVSQLYCKSVISAIAGLYTLW